MLILILMFPSVAQFGKLRFWQVANLPYVAQFGIAVLASCQLALLYPNRPVI